jgi:Methylamine utilisation protein MauE
MRLCAGFWPLCLFGVASSSCEIRFWQPWPWLISPLSLALLGVFEFLLGLALAVNVLPRVAVLVAFLLLGFFSLLIARSLWVGDKFACFCFGETDSSLSGWTLARTGALALLAGAAASVPAPDSLNQDFQTGVFQAIIALSLLGVIVLTASLPQLIAWGSDSFTGNRDVTTEAGK